MRAISARSRRPAGVVTSMPSSSWRASAGSSTGVLPTRTLCTGQRTEAAGLTGTTWPVTSQSNRWRTAASRCFTVGAERSRVCASTHVATCSGCTAVSDGTPCRSHQARNSATARP